MKVKAKITDKLNALLRLKNFYCFNYLPQTKPPIILFIIYYLNFTRI